MASIVTSSEPCAVIRITCVSGVSFLMWASRYMPLASGRRKSVKTRSYGEPLSSAVASLTVFAGSTTWPRSTKIICSASVTLGSSSTTRILLGGMVHILLLCRQRDGNLRTFPKSTVNTYHAVVLFDDFFCVRHTEAQPLLFGCIERLEHLFQLFLADASTGVDDFQTQRIFSSIRGDTQPAAIRHRLNGVEYEVHQSSAHGGVVNHSGGGLLAQR